jgi:anti-sigma factor (TIGR02949 family)
MRIVNFQAGECNRLRSYLDSYLNNELLVETSHEMLKHLERCAECAAALEGRIRVKAQLKRAVLNEQAPEALRERIQRDIRRTRSGFSWGSSLMVAAAAAVLVFAVAVGVFYRSSTNHAGTVRQALSINAEVASDDAAGQILRVGFDDHVFCALDHETANRNFTAEEMSESLGPQFGALVPLVKERVSPDYSIVVGHRCHYQNREFVHLILRRHGDVVSLIVTRKIGESFPPSGAAAIIRAAGIELHEASWHNLQVAGMETRDHLVFLVSNVPKADNERIASSVVPVLSEFLRKEEA